jgi:dUTP pyrophosphatase
MSKDDNLPTLVAKIGKGLTGVFFRDYLGGSLPAGWQLDPNVLVLPTMHGDVAAVVHAKAWSPNGRPVGAKLTIDARKEIQEIAAELAAGLLANIKTHADMFAAHDEIRFALVDGAKQPTRGSEWASGYDLYAVAGAVLNPGQIFVVDTGVILELPRGMEGQVRPRSGMTKRGLWVALGTVDADFRGTIGATIANLTRDNQAIEVGDRVAQLVIAEVVHKPWKLVERGELNATERGDRGWGSTGR